MWSARFLLIGTIIYRHAKYTGYLLQYIYSSNMFVHLYITICKHICKAVFHTHPLLWFCRAITFILCQCAKLWSGRKCIEIEKKYNELVLWDSKQKVLLISHMNLTVLYWDNYRTAKCSITTKCSKFSCLFYMGLHLFTAKLFLSMYISVETRSGHILSGFSGSDPI